MLLIGLTGGIGSGKSTVADRLAQLGAVVLDADRIAREVVAPGTTGLHRVRERFGAAMIGPGGELDRAALGEVVFADPAARTDLEAITHPLIASRTASRLAELPRDAVAVHDVPLLVELGYAPRYHLVLVVGADEATRMGRLTRDRRMTVADAHSRIRSQADDAARREVADAWLDNNGPSEALLDQVDRLHASRLAPLHRNLLAGVAAGPRQVVPATPGEDVASRPHRVLARLRWVTGSDASTVAQARPDRAPPLEWTDLALAVLDPDDDEIAGRLAAGGFPRLGNRLHGSCDPGRPGGVTLRPTR